MLLPTTVISLLVALAAANPKNGATSTCTTAIRTGSVCGCGIPASTATTLIDCHGCVIQDIAGPHCAIACESSTVDLFATTTLTSCLAEATADNKMKPRRRN